MRQRQHPTDSERPATHRRTAQLLTLTLVLLGLALVLPAAAFASGGWLMQHSGTGNQLNPVDFLNSGHGRAVGDDGVVITTTHGGADLRAEAPGTMAYLDRVDFVDASHGWVVGNQYDTVTGVNAPILLATTDGGAVWSQQTSLADTGYYLNAVDFLNASRGWAVASSYDQATSTSTGIILATTDGGATWSQDYSGGDTLNDVHFRDASHGWAVGSESRVRAGVTYYAALTIRTSDGGKTWRAHLLGGPYVLTHIGLVNAKRGWAVGYTDSDLGLTFSTSNGGSTWRPHSPAAHTDPVGIAFSDSRHGWVVGNTFSTYDNITGGAILHTANGGATWKKQKSHTKAGLFAAAFVNARRGWAVGNSGAILVTSNGGATWKKQKSGTRDRLDAVAFVNARRGWAVGYDPSTGASVILATVNGGGTWTDQYR